MQNVADAVVQSQAETTGENAAAIPWVIQPVSSEDERGAGEPPSRKARKSKKGDTPSTGYVIKPTRTLLWSFCDFHI